MSDELRKLNEDVWGAICEDLEDFEVVAREITGNWRHGTEEEMVVKSKVSGKFYKSCFRDSPKEMDFEDMNGSEAAFFEVVPEEKTVITYKKTS
jgi:hypothetical protein